MNKMLVSIFFAIDGLCFAFKNEKNFRIEIVTTTIVFIVGYICSINTEQWLIVVFNVGAVLTAEMFNTAIENTANLITDKPNPAVKIIKDTAAAAVLLSAISACICGCIVFLPYASRALYFLKN